MNKIFALIMLLFSASTFGECLNEINNESDLFVSNMYNYEITVHAKITDISLNEIFNPLTYFKSHRIYTYKADIKNTFKGSKSGQICLFEWREEPFESVSEMHGKDYLISFNNSGECSLIEVGAILRVNDALLRIAENGREK